MSRNRDDTAVAAGNISIYENDPMDLASVQTASDLLITATGEITDSGTLNVGGALTATILNDNGSNLTFDQFDSSFGSIVARIYDAGGTNSTPGNIAVQQAQAMEIVQIITDGTAAFIAPGINVSGEIDCRGAAFYSGSSNFSNQAPINCGTGDLSITARDIQIEAALSGLGSLVLYPYDAGSSIALGNNVSGDYSLNNSEIANLRDGFNNITIGRSDGTGLMTINQVTFTDPVTISNYAPISIKNTITGSDNASITINGSQGIKLYADIVTNGNDIYADDNVALYDDIELASNQNNFAGGDITINGDINGNYHLAINAGTSGTATIAGSIGLDEILTDINVVAQDINLHNVTTTGPQQYQASGVISLGSSYQSTTAGDIIFAGNLNLLDDISVDTAAGDVTFNGTIDGPYDLCIDAGTGDIYFADNIGSIRPLTLLEAITRPDGIIKFGNCSIVNVAGDIIISVILEIEDIPTSATIYKLEPGALEFNAGGNFTMKQNNKFAVVGGSLSIITETGNVTLGDLIATGDIIVQSAAGQGDIYMLTREPADAVIGVDEDGIVILKQDKGLNITAGGGIIFRGNIVVLGEGPDPYFASVETDYNEGLEGFRFYRIKEFPDLYPPQATDDDGIIVYVPVGESAQDALIHLLAGLLQRNIDIWHDIRIAPYLTRLLSYNYLRNGSKYM